MTEPDAILTMRGITKTFPGVVALAEVNLTVRRGEIHAICGENGAGKSTLMKVLSGVYAHGSYEGEIVFEGEPCAFSGIRDSEARGIVIIHQELALCPQLSIAENMFLGNERATRGLVDWNRTNHEAEQLLARVGLKERPVTPVLDIGVGKQQLVEIAKALSKEVRLLILDEPTAALNDDDSAHLLDLLRELRDQGITCVVISHKLNEIAAVADTLTILRDGRTIETLDMGSGEVTEDRIISGMVGRDLEHRFPPHESTIGEEVLRIEDWTVHSPTQPDRAVVRDASLTLRRGEIVGLAGLMGAGRTELAMSVFGRSYGVGISGRLVKDGEPIEVRSVRDAIRHGIAYATEDRKRYGLNLHRRHQAQRLRRRTRQARAPRLGRRRRGVPRRGGLPPQHEHQGTDRRERDRAAVRRQPAEGRAVEVDLHRSRRADPRRAHPRHRRRRQVRDLHDRQPAGRRGEGGPRHLLGAAGAAGHLRPHLRARGGPDHRRARPRRRHAGAPHAAHDRAATQVPHGQEQAS